MDTSAVDEKTVPWTIIDVSSEQYRAYTYPDGVKFRINRPKTLYVLADGGHRIVDKNDVTHRPERGYVGISWLPKDGEPPFVA
jgi:hypothetical protein